MEEICFELGGIDILIYSIEWGMHFKFENIPTWTKFIKLLRITIIFSGTHFAYRI